MNIKKLTHCVILDVIGNICNRRLTRDAQTCCHGNCEQVEGKGGLQAIRDKLRVRNQLVLLRTIMKESELIRV